MKQIPLIEVENMKKYYPIKGGIITHTTGFVKAVDGVTSVSYTHLTLPTKLEV